MGGMPYYQKNVIRNLEIMETNKERFTTLRKVTKEEMPRESRAKNFREARVKVMEQYSTLEKKISELEHKIEDYNLNVDKNFLKKVGIAAKEAERSGQQLSQEQRQMYENERDAGYRDAYQESYYFLLDKEIAALGVCEPDVDSISPTSIRPSQSVVLMGTCFGPSQGKVLLKISDEYIVELEVSSWTETSITACLNYLISNTPLHSYYGEIWILTGEGVSSNVWPIMYDPVNSYYYASRIKHVFGGAFGKKVNGKFCNDKHLTDSEFSINHVARSHWGSGWSEKRSPNASGRSLEQGWHIGVRAWGHAYMKIGYQVKGPKGISPTYIEELGHWALLGHEY